MKKRNKEYYERKIILYNEVTQEVRKAYEDEVINTEEFVRLLKVLNELAIETLYEAGFINRRSIPKFKQLNKALEICVDLERES